MGKKKEPLPVEEVSNFHNIITLTTVPIQGYVGREYVVLEILPCNTTII